MVWIFLIVIFLSITALSYGVYYYEVILPIRRELRGRVKDLFGAEIFKLKSSQKEQWNDTRNWSNENKNATSKRITDGKNKPGKVIILRETKDNGSA